jgi:2-oxoisovalerate dehydrogenase E2 component (dihydrolipoyl transacylase)
LRLRNGTVEERKMLPISLTVDHRAVTGGEATRFLATLGQQLRLA